MDAAEGGGTGAPRKAWLWALRIAWALGLPLLLVALVEFVVQTFLLDEEIRRYVHDIEHWPKPGDHEELNSDGLRLRLEPEAFADDGLNVALLGDSFVYGWKLAYEETIPWQLERLANTRHADLTVRVANFGWTSSSPLLSYRRLAAIGARYEPDVVVLAVDMTDFHDDVKYELYLGDRGVYRFFEWVPVTILFSRWMTARLGLTELHESVFGMPAERFFVTEQPLAESRPYLEPIRRNIAATARHVREELGAHFSLVVFPRCFQYSDRESPDSWENDAHTTLGPHSLEPFAFFDELRENVDHPVHSLLERFQKTRVFPTCFADDPHWNADGARLAAEGVYDALHSDGVFD